MPIAYSVDLRVRILHDCHNGMALCDALAVLQGNDGGIEIMKGGQRIAAPLLTPESIGEYMFRITDAEQRKCSTMK